MTGQGAEAVEVRDDPTASRYEIRSEGELAGFMTYRLHDGRITLIHTEVDDAHAGHGLGGRLVRGALEDVRARGLALIPVCPFVTSIIRHDPDRYLDLVPPDARDRVMADDASR